MVQYTEWRSISDGSIISDIPDSELTQTADHIWYHNEGQGTTLGDSVGNKDGVIDGSSWGSGQGTEDVYLDHDGANDFVDLGDFTYTGSMSAAIWAYPQDDSNHHLINLFNEDGGPGSVNAQFLIVAVDGEWRVVVAGEDGDVANTFGSVELNEWQLLCLDFDGTTATGYQYSLIEGGLKDSTSYSTANELSVTDDPFFIADRPVVSDRHFEGRTDYMTLEFAANAQTAFDDHFAETRRLYE